MNSAGLARIMPVVIRQAVMKHSNSDLRSCAAVALSCNTACCAGTVQPASLLTLRPPCQICSVQPQAYLPASLNDVRFPCYGVRLI